MTHLTDMQTGVLIASAGGGGVFLVVASILAGRRTPLAAAPKPTFATFAEELPADSEAGEYRHCPACDRDRYSAVHADGSACCWTCKTEIPGGTHV